MRKYGFIILVMATVISLSACGKKEAPLQESTLPMSMENLTVSPGTEIPTPISQAASGAPAESLKLETLPPAGPYTPTAQEIQTALKNANFYTGNIDGKLGPKTKKAIEEFQKLNDLEADGKVGPKTWSVLSKYLAPAQTNQKSVQ